MKDLEMLVVVSATVILFVVEWLGLAKLGQKPRWITVCGIAGCIGAEIISKLAPQWRSRDGISDDVAQIAILYLSWPILMAIGQNLSMLINPLCFSKEKRRIAMRFYPEILYCLSAIGISLFLLYRFG